MPIPWIQVDQDGLVRGATLGRLLGIGPHAGRGLALALWAYALDTAPRDADGVPDLSGRVASVDVLAAGVDYPVENCGKLSRALSDVGLFDPKTLRVKGLDRYAPYFAKRRNDRERKKRSAEVAATSGGSDGVDQDQDLDRDVRGVNEPLPPPPTSVDGVENPAAAAERLFDVLMTKRHAEHGLIREPMPKDFAIWLQETRTPVAGLIWAYLRYLLDDHFRIKGWPLKVFMAKKVWSSRLGVPKQRERKL